MPVDPPEPCPDPAERHTGAAAAVEDENHRHLLVPGTGEVLSLDAPTDLLADAVQQIRESQRGLAELRKLIEAELAARLSAHERSVLLAGEFEVRVSERNDAVWDADELEAVLRDLIDSGTVHAAEVVGVITHETKVSRSAAGRLAKRLRGAARQRVEACRHWQKRYGPVEVVRSQPLIPPELEADLRRGHR